MMDIISKMQAEASKLRSALQALEEAISIIDNSLGGEKPPEEAAVAAPAAVEVADANNEVADADKLGLGDITLAGGRVETPLQKKRRQKKEANRRYRQKKNKIDRAIK